MNNIEFKEYKKNLLSGMTVNPDGTTTNDNNHMFYVSYANEENVMQKDPIVAKTVSEAIYRICFFVAQTHMPLQSECVSLCEQGKQDELMAKLRALSNFDPFKILEIKDDKETNALEIKLTFTLDGKVELYTLTSENKLDEEVVDIEIDDNIIAVYTKPDDDTIICTICTSPLSLSTPFNDKNITVEDMFSYLQQFIMFSGGTTSCYIGFASRNHEDDDDITVGMEVSRDRALLDKIKNDKKQLRAICNNSKEYLESVKSTVTKLESRIRKLNRRYQYIERKIRCKN